jgi:hypothetical protein
VNVSAAQAQAPKAKRQWTPHKGPQTDFLACSAFEAGFGGAAGPGKSEALLVAALRYIDRPDYRAILFRRTYPELEKSLIERTRKYFAAAGAVYNEQKKTWTFPSGAKVILSQLQYDASVNEHLSAEYQYIAFDEAVTFTEKQFTFLMSRLRSSTGIPCRIRWASNPADDDAHWLIKRYGPWIDTRPTYTGHRAKPGETLWFAIDERGEEKLVPKGTPGALGRCYFPAKLTDNPTLMKNDPGYADRIRRMGQAAAKRFLDGDWFARDVKGALFDQRDIDRNRVQPHEVPELRYVGIGVDPAVSSTDTSDEHGIVGGGVSDNGHVYVLEDCSRKGTPNDWGTTTVASFRRLKANTVVAEVNNGGDLVEANIANIDMSVSVKKVSASRGKAIRAEPVATLMRRNRIHFVGAHPELESELRRWIPPQADGSGSKWSPNHMDAFVWLVSELVPGIIDEVAEEKTPEAEDARMEREAEERENASDDESVEFPTEWVPE